MWVCTNLIGYKLGSLSHYSYRNYLMACTALMGQEQQPRYASLLESPSPPGIRRLQKLIEEAWKEGESESELVRKAELLITRICR